MARIFLVNGSAASGALRLPALRAITVTLLLSDADASVGDEWELVSEDIDMGYPKKIIEEVEDRLQTLGWQSDIGYAEAGDRVMSLYRTSGTDAEPLTPVWTQRFEVQPSIEESTNSLGSDDSRLSLGNKVLFAVLLLSAFLLGGMWVTVTTLLGLPLAAISYGATKGLEENHPSETAKKAE